MTGSPIRLHPRLAPVVVSSALFGLGGAVALRALSDAPPPPFLPTSGALTAVMLLYAWFARIRRQGLRIDDDGIMGIRRGVRIPWTEIARVRLATEARAFPGGRTALLRYASLEAADGRSIRFADLGGLGAHATIDIEDVPDAPLALALVAERCGVTELAPASPATGAASVEDNAAPPTASPSRPPAPSAMPLRDLWGFVTVLLKLGPKLAKFLLTGLKLVKPGAAAVTFGVYAMFASWQFGVALMIMIFWHEYGHVRAMHRIGHPVKGIYFIPFLGGVAVHNAPIADRRHRVYVDLNGPAFGLYLTLVPLALLLAFPGRWPWMAPLCAWWALINLFNLLPILPLDGGRALAAIAFSLGSRLGAALVLGGLLLGAGLAIARDLGLIALVTLVGAVELLTEIAGGRRRRLLNRMRGGRHLDFATWSRLLGATRPPIPGAATTDRLAVEHTGFEHLMSVARGRMMTLRETVLAIIAYAVLAAALGAVFVYATGLPGGDAIRDLFR